MTKTKCFFCVIHFALTFCISTQSRAQVDTASYKRTGETFSFTVDTVRTNGDSTFVVVNGFYDKVLAFHNQTIFLPNSCIIHGLSTNFYPNGAKRSEGNYAYGFKTNNWKYWDASGKEISESEYRILTNQ